MSDVLDFSGHDVYRSGLGGDSPGPDLRGDQLPGSDQEGGQLGAASEGEKMSRLSEKDIKPCPFCGAPAKSQSRFARTGIMFYVSCIRCRGGSGLYKEWEDALARIKELESK